MGKSNGSEQRKELLERRNIDVRNYFNLLYNEGKFRYDHCMEKTIEKFYITESTITKILKGQ